MDNNIETIYQIEALLAKLKSSLGAVPTKVIGKAIKTPVEPSATTYSGLTGEIHNLVQEGFFKEPKTLAEIQNKLRLEGVNKPTTTLMKPLILLVRKKVLGRAVGPDGKGPYKYHQR